MIACWWTATNYASQDGILAWADALCHQPPARQYVIDGIKKLQDMQHKKRCYRQSLIPPGMFGFMEDYYHDPAFNGLFGLRKEYSDYDVKECLLNTLWTPNLSNPLGEIDASTYFLGACNIIQDHSSFNRYLASPPA
jgi:hypothetical protein